MFTYAVMSFASNNGVDNGGDRKEAFSGFAGVPINARRVSGPLYSMGLYAAAFAFQWVTGSMACDVLFDNSAMRPH